MEGGDGRRFACEGGLGRPRQRDATTLPTSAPEVGVLATQFCLGRERCLSRLFSARWTNGTESDCNVGICGLPLIRSRSVDARLVESDSRAGPGCKVLTFCRPRPDTSLAHVQGFPRNQGTGHSVSRGKFSVALGARDAARSATSSQQQPSRPSFSLSNGAMAITSPVGPDSVAEALRGRSGGEAAPNIYPSPGTHRTQGGTYPLAALHVG